MLERFLFFLITTWTVSQSFKFLFKQSIHKRSLRDIKNTYLYYSGPPSTHSAVLAMTALYIGTTAGFESPVFLSVLVFGVLWVYEILLQRKRFHALVALIGNDDQNQLLASKELNGHDAFDISIGLLLGVLLFFCLNWYWPIVLR